MKQSTICLLFGLLLLNPLFSQSTTFDTGKVPFEMVKNAIVLPVQINGKSYRFILDTGGVLMISKKLQDALELEEIDKTVVSDVSKLERDFTTVMVPEIQIGAATFSNCKSLVDYASKDYPNSCFGADGMIGRDFFYDKILEMDYASGMLRLSDQEANFDLDKAYRTKLKLSKRGLPDVKLSIDGKKKFIEFDSGSGDFFSFQKAQVERMKNKGADEILTCEGIFSFGVSSQEPVASNRYRVKVNELKIGATSFGNFYSDFTKTSAPRIGASILYYGKVIMDLKNMDFYYKPYEEATLPPFKTFGFDIGYLDGEYIVKWVLEGSKAADQGMKYGHKISAINGQPMPTGDAICKGYIEGYDYKKKDSVFIEFIDHYGNPSILSLKQLTYE